MSTAQVIVGCVILLAIVILVWGILWLERRNWCKNCRYSRWEPHAYENRLYCYHSAMRGARVPPKDRPDGCPLEFGVGHKEET